MILVLDYGVGNLGSIVNMFRRAGADATTGSASSDIAAADHLVLPGVGAFDATSDRVKAYFARLAERPAYRRALAKDAG